MQSIKRLVSGNSSKKNQKSERLIPLQPASSDNESKEAAAPNGKAHVIDITMDQADLLSAILDDGKESCWNRTKSTAAKLLAITPSGINTAANATGVSTSVMNAAWFLSLSTFNQIKTIGYFGASMFANMYVAGDYLEMAKTLVSNIAGRCSKKKQKHKIGDERDVSIFLSSIPTTIAVGRIGYEGFLPIGLVIFGEGIPAIALAFMLAGGASILFYTTRVSGVKKLYLKHRGREHIDVLFTRELADKTSRIKPEFEEKANIEVEKAFILDALRHIPIKRTINKQAKKDILNLEDNHNKLYESIKNKLDQEDYNYDSFIKDPEITGLPHIIWQAIKKAKENFKNNVYNRGILIEACDRVNIMLDHEANEKKIPTTDENLFREKTWAEKCLPPIEYASAAFFAITCNPVFAEKFLRVVDFGFFPTWLWIIAGEILALPSAALYANAGLELPHNLLDSARTLGLTDSDWRAKLKSTLRRPTLFFGFGTTCNVISGGGMQNVAEHALYPVKNVKPIQEIPGEIAGVVVAGTTAGATGVNLNSFLKIPKFSGKPGIHGLSVALRRTDITTALPAGSYQNQFYLFFSRSNSEETRLRKPSMPRSPSTLNLRRTQSFAGV